MPKISQYPANSSPDTSFLFLGTDPLDKTEGPTGTTETVSYATLLAPAVRLGGDIGGTVDAPEVLKIQGQAITAPPGGTSDFLRADGAWAVPPGTGGGTVPGMQVIWMDAQGADHTGATSVTSLFNTLLADQAGAPTLFLFGVGTYLWGTAPNSLGKNQSIMGMGSRVTTFTWSGTGPLFTLTEAAVSGTWNGSDNAGDLSGFTISGPYGNAGTAGIKYGALQGLRVDDVGFYGLDGGCVEGYQVTSGVDWAEEAIMTRLDISGCGATSGYVFGFNTTSFDYTAIDAVVVVEANIDILRVQSNAQMQGLKLGLRGNLHGGTSNTGAVIAVERGNSSGTGLIGGAVFEIGMEGDNTSDGGAGNVGHYALYMGSSNSASQVSAGGVFSIFNAGAPCQPVYNPSFLPVSLPPFLNITADSAGNLTMSDGDALVVSGGATEIWAGQVGSALGTVVYCQFGSKWVGVLAAGANALTFSGLNGYGRDLDLLLTQPASGGPSTVTWPSNVKWPGGTAPTLSTAANATDWVRLVFMPQSVAGVSGGYFVGHLVASGYTL